MAVKLDYEVGPNWAENLCLQLHVDNLGGVWLDHSIPHVDIVGGNALGLLILRLDLEPGAQVVLVDDLNLLRLRVLQEAIVELEELVRLNAHFWNDALGFDWHCKHVLTDAFEVDHEHHVVFVRHAWDKLDHDLGGAVLGQPTSVVLDVELVLEGAAVARHAHHIVDVDLRSVRQIDCLGLRELVGNMAEVDNVFGEAEGWRDDVPFERQCQHLRAALEGEAECLRELTEDVAHESHPKQVSYMLTHAKRAICPAEVELRAERRLVWNQLPMAVDLASIFDTELEGLLVRHEDVTDVHLGDGELGLGALALAGEVQRQALLVAGDIGEGRAGVVVGTLRTERDTAGHLRVRPNLALERLDLEDLVLEEHFVLWYRPNQSA